MKVNKKISIISIIICLVVAVICTACSNKSNENSDSNSINISGNANTGSGNIVNDSNDLSGSGNINSGSTINGSGNISGAENINSGSEESNIDNDNTITIDSVSIVLDLIEIEAGKDLSFSIIVNDDASIDCSKLNFETVITVGFDYCTAIDNNILINLNTPDNQEITFYVKCQSVKSEKCKFIVKNPKMVLENKIKAQETYLAELQNEYNTLYSQALQAKQTFETAERDYNNFEQQCRNMGYLVGNTWNENTPTSIRTQEARLFSNYNEAYARFSRLANSADSKNREINSVKSLIAKLKSELAEM